MNEGLMHCCGLSIRQNVGGADRALRILIGSVMIATAAYFQGIFGIITGCIGMGLFITGIFGFCMLYIPFGISTGKRRE